MPVASLKFDIQKPTILIIQLLDQRADDVAQLIHHLHMTAYTQEAHLIGIDEFPPLRVTVDEIQSSPYQFYGALDNDKLIGAVAIESNSPSEFTIVSLIVDPSHQRKGVGRRLLDHVINLLDGADLTVETAIKNHPAISLYETTGFIDSGRRTTELEGCQLIAFKLNTARA